MVVSCVWSDEESWEVVVKRELMILFTLPDDKFKQAWWIFIPLIYWKSVVSNKVLRLINFAPLQSIARNWGWVIIKVVKDFLGTWSTGNDSLTRAGYKFLYTRSMTRKSESWETKLCFAFHNIGTSQWINDPKSTTSPLNIPSTECWIKSIRCLKYPFMLKSTIGLSWMPNCDQVMTSSSSSMVP